MYPIKAGLLALAVVASASAQEPRIEFKGVPFGATRAEILAKLPFLDCRPAPSTQFADIICLGAGRVMKAQDFTYGGVQVRSLSLNLYGDTLVSVFVTIDPDSFSALSRTMVEGYGQPTKIDHPTLQSRGGVTVQNEVLTWQRGDVRVVASKYASRMDEGLVVLRTDAAIQEFMVSVRSGPLFPVESVGSTIVSTTNGSGHYEAREP